MKIIIDKKEIETELTLLKPTDIICFKVRSALNVEQYTRIKDKLKEILDVKNKILVMDCNTELNILREMED